MTESLFDVTVIGNIGIDTNVYLYGDEIDFNVEANFTQNLDYAGQAGGYASRGYAALGLRTAFIGYVGDDFQGEYIRRVLKRDGINQDGLFIDPAGTSRSVNIMYRDGRRKNFYDGKSHMNLNPPLDVCRGLLKNTKLAHFNIPNWGRYLLSAAKEAGTKIAVDLQDIVDVHDPYRKDFIDAADFLFFSAANHADPRPIVMELLSWRPQAMVISGMGAQGCMVGSGDGIFQYPAEGMESPVVDTNGAGDSLAVGFLYAHVFKGFPLGLSIRCGQIAARYCCSQKASTDHLITWDQLENHLQKEL